MDDVEARKQERSKSKMAVTLAARRLISATNRDADFEVIKALIVELEKAYDDFCVVSEEYELLVSDEKFSEHRVVNGDDLTTYNANVKQTYEEARNVYGIIKAENEKSKQNLAMAPLRTTIKRDMNRLQDIISAVDTSLTEESPSLDSLQMDRSDMEQLLDEICDKVTKLAALQPDTQLQDDVEAIMGTAFNRIRRVNLYLKENQASKVPMTSINVGECAKSSESIISVNFTPSETSNSQTLENGLTSVLVEPSATNMPLDSHPHGIPPEIPAPPVICSTTATAPQQSITSSTLSIGNPRHCPL
jgi:hypothetical protein